MIRIGIAFALYLVVASVVVAAETWEFDETARAAGIANGNSSLVVMCADPGLGLIYRIEKSAVRGKRNAVFTFSDSTTELSVEGVSLKTDGSLAYVALSGRAAAELIERVAEASSKVTVGLAIPKSSGFDVLVSSQFSAIGSVSAIRAAKAACNG